jgi:predicted amino acid dehydrogenase
LTAAHDYGIAITTGASLTSAVTVKMIERATDGLGVQLPRATLALVGATGEVGRGCSMALHSRVAKVVLVGRNKTRLERLKDELVDQGARPGCVLLSTDLTQSVVDADIIITLASTPDLPIPSETLKPGTILCDVGYPRNVGAAVRSRRDIHVFDGGLVQLPKVLPFNIETATPAPDLLFGCFAEAIILAIENHLVSYSSGPGSVTTSRMEEIYALATKHGFREACPLSMLQNDCLKSA